jgi:hypothetical protein
MPGTSRLLANFARNTLFFAQRYLKDAPRHLHTRMRSDEPIIFGSPVATDVRQRHNLLLKRDDRLFDAPRPAIMMPAEETSTSVLLAPVSRF